MAKSKISLDKLSAKDLDKLQADIDAQKKKLEKERVSSVAADIRKLLKDAGVAIEEVVPHLNKKPRATKPRGKVAPKYKNPEDPDQTWTGRGRKPLWVVAALESGKTLDDIAI